MSSLLGRMSVFDAYTKAKDEGIQVKTLCGALGTSACLACLPVPRHLSCCTRTAQALPTCMRTCRAVVRAVWCVPVALHAHVCAVGAAELARACVQRRLVGGRWCGWVLQLSHYPLSPTT